MMSFDLFQKTILPSCAVCALILTPAFADEQADALAGYVKTGETKDCISVVGGAPDETTPLDETRILFRAGRNYYLNELTGRCSNIGDPFYRIRYELHQAELCRNDRLTIVDNSSGQTAGFCRLGSFERLEKKDQKKTE